jgi:hypothetical protein
MSRKKPIKYEIIDLISEYNEDLYNEVSGKIEVKLQLQKGSWSAHIDEEGKAVIGYCKTESPDAAFAHELLHIKAELNGLKDPYVRSMEKDVDWSLIRFLINQLAHHRIYPEFYDLGFNEEEFLNDNDIAETKSLLNRDVPTIEKIVKQLGERIDGFAILLPYLVAISPHETNDDIKLFKERIVKIAKPEFIREIDDIIVEWVSSERMDYCLTLAKIFKACNKKQISFAPITDTDKEISAATV